MIISYGFFKSHPIRLSVVAFIGLLIFYGLAFANESTLTEQEKIEKRLQFNQYVESELALARQKQEEAAKHFWAFNYETAYGYDSNVNLNSDREGDEFYENNLEAQAKFKHPALGFLGEGNWGVALSSDFFHYGNFEESSYSDFGVNPFFDMKLSPALKFKFNYYLNHIHYERNPSLNYTSNKFKPALTYSFTKKLSMTLYQTFDIRSFSARKALTAADTNSDEDREDFYIEPGVNLRYAPINQVILGANAAYKNNDSNDIFQKFNDYDGLKTSAYVNIVLKQRLSTVFYTGYDFKKYNARTFDAAALVKEKDSFLYYGSSLNFDINSYCQYTLGYTYKQNYSNDVSQDYSGYTLSTGLNFIF